MKFFKITVLTLVLTMPQATLAAVEYFRFEGFIDLSHQSSDTPFDFTSGQKVYFDFQVDTALEAFGKTDGIVPFGTTDFFQTAYLGGSVSPAQETFGVTYSFQEGMTSFLHATDLLAVGVVVEDLFPAPDDDSISVWSVGGIGDLTYNGITDNDRIGLVQLTYRDSQPPPAIVPLPSALLLFLSSLLGLKFFSRRALDPQF